MAEQFYKKYFGIELPFDHQINMWERLHAKCFPLLLKAPTGSGKTEAVLAPFLSQFIDNNFYIAPRMIYVLPMRVLVNSVAERIKKYAQKISPYISVEIQHGDIPNSPFFIGDIIVTTLDQFLYGFARASGQVGRHIDIPAGSIASSLVVFDEAHMYRDSFTFSIMRALMEILQKSNIPFVVMTATMPESLEESLFENINLEKDQKLIGNITLNNSLKIEIENKPLYSNGSINISEVLLERIKQQKTLIILNQVKRAQKIYEDIKSHLELSDEQIVLLHSRFTRSDREEHEKKAISLIPHKKDGKIVIPKGVGIVVSTQVLEAGIDFSAELLLTELAPADSLIQRAGRCARYEGQSGEMIIFPVEDDKGHLPYQKEHLAKTIEWLQKNQNFNIRNFDEVCSFVNHTLDYQANDYEARDTLIDLYECVLYADSQPQNIQLRDSKTAKLVVLDIPEGSGEKVRKKILESTESIDITSKTITVDTGILWSLFRDKDIDIQWEIQWKYDENEKKFKLDVIDILKNKKQKDEKDSRVGPFRTYILNSKNYRKEKGIYPDACAII
jgi:CRISPR-associated endonuclease/helicase Cas3